MNHRSRSASSPGIGMAMAIAIAGILAGCGATPPGPVAKADETSSDSVVASETLAQGDPKAPEFATNVVLTPLSGRFGFHLAGPHGLQGTITKENQTDKEWNLRATMEFPTSGYSVADPRVIVMESFPEQVAITITVAPPPPGARVTRMPVSAPVSADIAASNEAKFMVRVRDAAK